MVLFLLNLNIIHTFDFVMSIVEFEQMNARWKVLVGICPRISLHSYKEISLFAFIFKLHFLNYFGTGVIEADII